MRRQRIIAMGLAAGAVALAGIILLRYRVELFVLPARFREVVRLHELRDEAGEHWGEEDEPWQEADRQLTRAADELIRLQRPGFEGALRYGLEAVRTHEGKQAFLLIYRGREPLIAEEPEVLEAGLHLVAVDARGRIFGSELQAPPWPNAPVAEGQDEEGFRAEAPSDGTPSVIAVGGDCGCLLSVDARGIVPRGAVVSFPAPPDCSAPLVSSGNSAAVRRWLASLRDPPPTRGEAEQWLKSSRPGDLFRALHAIERLGRAASHLARPLLVHPDADLRARAAVVLGNEESLWRDLVPLTSDPAPQVRAAARFALLRAPDLGTARAAFVDLLRERNDYVQEADFDHERLLWPEAAADMLDAVEETGYAQERFVKALRREDLLSLVVRLEALWVHPTENTVKILGRMTALVPWLVRAEAPRLDQLLLDAIERECPGEDRWSLGLAEYILQALLQRASRLDVEGAVETLLHCTANRLLDRTAVIAHILLIHWQVPGAAERLLARPCQAGTDCLQDLLDADTFERRLPSSLRATLEGLARRQEAR